MSDRDAEDGHSTRLLRALLWTGVGLAPVAALVVLVGGNNGPVRFGVLLIAVCIALLGASLLIRHDPVLARLHVEERVAEQVESLREEMRTEIAAARIAAFQAGGGRPGPPPAGARPEPGGSPGGRAAVASQGEYGGGNRAMAPGHPAGGRGVVAPEQGVYGSERAFEPEQPYDAEQPYGAEQSYGAKRSYGAGSADGGDYGAEAAYGTDPAYGAEPAYGHEPAYGAEAGYHPDPAYGVGPAHGAGSVHGADRAYGAEHGHETGAAYDAEPVYGKAAGYPPEPARAREHGGASEHGAVAGGRVPAASAPRRAGRIESAPGWPDQRPAAPGRASVGAAASVSAAAAVSVGAASVGAAPVGAASVGGVSVGAASVGGVSVGAASVGAASVGGGPQGAAGVPMGGGPAGGGSAGAGSAGGAVPGQRARSSVGGPPPMAPVFRPPMPPPGTSRRDDGVYGGGRPAPDDGRYGAPSEDRTYGSRREPAPEQSGRRRADVTAVDLGYTGRRSRGNHAAGDADPIEPDSGGFGAVDGDYPGWSEADERHGADPLSERYDWRGRDSTGGW